MCVDNLVEGNFQSQLKPSQMTNDYSLLMCQYLLLSLVAQHHL